MKALILLMALFAVPAHAGAPIVCEAKNTFGSKVRVTVFPEKRRAVIQSASLRKPVIIENVEDVWDGHMTGLMTARGFAMKYENHYGCIRNAVVTTNIRDGIGFIDQVSMGTCGGGSTPDDICLGRR